MTPKEKAKELVDKFKPHSDEVFEFNAAKKCALISVNEILWALTYECPPRPSNRYQTPEFWLEVKSEIEAL